MNIKREPIKYIDGDRTKGIEIDWKKAFKYYEQLGCPDNVYNPAKELKIDKATWFVLISGRSTGKTTNIVLLGMILNLMYGINIAYVRQTEDMTAKQELDKFLDVITQNGYIEKMTDGKWNSGYYYAHVYRWAKVGKDTKIEEKGEPFLHAVSIDRQERYKSTFNVPTADIILFDEFISTRYSPNEFIELNQLIKTILRDRVTGKIFMLANTTNYYNEYLRELMIQDDVLKVQEDQPFIKKTPLGTQIFVHLIGNRNLIRAKVNTLYFGFDNPRLASITGGSWSIPSYPHIAQDDRLDPRKIITDKFYMVYSGKILQLDLAANKKMGLHVLVHPCRRIHDDAISVFTCGDIEDNRYKYRFGTSKSDKLYFKLYNQNKWFFYDNDAGFTVEAYVKTANKL